MIAILFVCVAINTIIVGKRVAPMEDKAARIIRYCLCGFPRGYNHTLADLCLHTSERPSEHDEERLGLDKRRRGTVK